MATRTRTNRLAERGRLEMFGRVVDTVYNDADGHKDFHPVGRWTGEGGRPWSMACTSPWSLSKLWHDEIQRDAVPSNDHKQLPLRLEGVTVIMTSLGVDHRKQARCLELVSLLTKLHFVASFDTLWCFFL